MVIKVPLPLVLQSYTNSKCFGRRTSPAIIFKYINMWEILKTWLCWATVWLYCLVMTNRSSLTIMNDRVESPRIHKTKKKEHYFWLQSLIKTENEKISAPRFCCLNLWPWFFFFCLFTSPCVQYFFQVFVFRLRQQNGYHRKTYSFYSSLVWFATKKNECGSIDLTYLKVWKV